MSDEARALNEAMRLVEYDMFNRRYGDGDGFVGERKEVATIINALRRCLATAAPLKHNAESLTDKQPETPQKTVVSDKALASLAREPAPVEVSRSEVERRAYRIAYAPLRSAQHALDIIGHASEPGSRAWTLAREESVRIDAAITALRMPDQPESAEDAK